MAGCAEAMSTTRHRRADGLAVACTSTGGPCSPSAPVAVQVRFTWAPVTAAKSSIVPGAIIPIEVDFGKEAGGDFGGAYVAKGTYSLPVTLPAGQVRLDFARPSGDAELSITAVPARLIDNAQNTAVLAAISIIVATAFALIRKISRSLKGRKAALVNA